MMGNGIEIMMKDDVLHKPKFDKRSVAIGILGAAYMGRLLHTVVNMADIALVEVSSSDEEPERDQESCGDEDSENCSHDQSSDVDDELFCCDKSDYNDIDRDRRDLEEDGNGSQEESLSESCCCRKSSKVL